MAALAGLLAAVLSLATPHLHAQQALVYPAAPRPEVDIADPHHPASRSRAAPNHRAKGHLVRARNGEPSGEHKEDGARHENWGNFDDYWNILSWVLVVLITLSLIVDEGLHRLTHWLQHRAGEETGEERPELDNAWQLHLLMLRRFKSEMTMLGFLAFLVFILVNSGFFSSLVGEEHTVHEPPEAHPKKMLSALSVSEETGVEEWCPPTWMNEWDLCWSYTADGDYDVLINQTNEAERKNCCAPWYNGFYNSLFYLCVTEDDDVVEVTGKTNQCPEACKRRAPKKSETLKEIVEIAHMSLFLTMAFYFVIIFSSLAIVSSVQKMHARVVADDASGAEPSGCLERAMLRAVRRTRRILLSEFQTDATLSNAIKTDVNVRATVSSGRINTVAFMSRTSERGLLYLIEFPTATWICILFLQLSLSLMLQFWCSAYAVSIFFSLNILSLCIVSYFLVRQCIFFARLLAADDGASESKCTAVCCPSELILWPWPLFDRIFGAGFLFATGYVPWSSRPSEIISFTCIQCILFFQLNIFVWSFTDINFGLIQHKQFPSSWLLYTPASNQVNPALRDYCAEETGECDELASSPIGFVLPDFATTVPIITMLLWIVLIATHIVATALPPFLDEGERQLLLTVVRDSPDGVVAPFRSSLMFSEASASFSPSARRSDMAQPELTSVATDRSASNKAGPHTPRSVGGRISLEERI